jgi:hypothetical protein
MVKPVEQVTKQADIPEVKTKMDLIVSECLRPFYQAVDLLRQEVRSSIGIPNDPLKILGIPYEQLSDMEVWTLLEIYHEIGETEPCAMCKLVLGKEIPLEVQL